MIHKHIMRIIANQGRSRFINRNSSTLGTFNLFSYWRAKYILPLLILNY